MLNLNVWHCGKMRRFAVKVYPRKTQLSKMKVNESEKYWSRLQDMSSIQLQQLTCRGYLLMSF